MVERDISRRFFYIALAIVVLVAGGMRLATLSARSLDNDETITAFDITGAPYFWLPRDEARPVNSYANEYHAVRESSFATWLEVVRTVQRNEEHPPLYFLLQGLWCRMFGMEHGGLRSFSAILGILTIPALGFTALLITRKRNVALLAALLLTISPLHVFYSQEARPYAMLALIGVASLYCFARMEREQSWQWAVWLGLIYFAGVMTQYLFALLPAAQLAYCLLSPAGRKTLSKCAAAQLGAIVMFLPWVPTAMYQLSTKVGASGAHELVPFADRVRQGAYAFASYWCGMDMHINRVACLLAALVGWGAILYWAVRRKGESPGAAHAGAVAILPFALPAIAWLTWSLPDIWTRPKHYLLLLPAVAIAFCWAVVSMRRWRGIGLALVVMVPMTISTVGYYPCLEHKSDVKSAAAFLHAEVGDTDLLITQGSCSQISYYSPGVPNRVHITRWTPELLAKYDRIALFTTQDPSTPTPATTRTREWLRGKYALEKQAQFYDAAVEVYRRVGL